MAPRYWSTTDYWAARTVQEISRGYLPDLDDLRLLGGLARAQTTLAPASEPRTWERPKTRPSPSPSSSARPSSNVELRAEAQPRYTVHLTDAVRCRIREEIADAFQDFGRVFETGGLLYAHRRPGLERASVCLATGPGPGSLHGPTSFRSGKIAAIEAEFPDFLDPESFQLAGDYHSHPNGGTRPSQPDLEGWAAKLNDRCMSRYVGLILTRGEEGYGWSYPTFTAWVMSPTFEHNDETVWRSGAVCEPARIEFSSL